jgi:signal transduction histidine kinase/ActR/RegA family two-component response regulator
MTRLQALSTRLVQTGELQALLREILSAAADLTGTDKGNIQFFDPDSGRLRIAVHQGLGQRLVEHFADTGWIATCEAAAQKHERVIVEDVAALIQLAGTVELDIVLEDGIRAIQSTPIVSRDGRLLGMLNNHYRERHRPADHELRYLDLLARMAADFVERCRTEAALQAKQRELEAELYASRRLHEIAARMVEAQDFEGLLEETLDAAIDITGADMGTVQLRTGNTLKLAAQRGFDASFCTYFATVEGDGCSCGAALAAGQRILVSDVLTSPVFDAPTRAALLASDARAVQSTPLLDRSGEVIGMFSTHYRKAEQQPGERMLRSLDLLARLAADLIQARTTEQALREADRRKDTFLATLAHELRGPLAPISNALEVLHQAPEDRTAALWAHEIMKRQLDQLIHLVDDLLDLSRITQDKIELRKQPTALQAVVEQAIEGCRPLLNARKLRLSLAFPPQEAYVDADAVRLTQVFTNLIHNAIKFTDPEGAIRIVVESAGPQAIVRVQDSGIGIPPSWLETIFGIFSQIGRSAAQKEGGLGIGLYLARRLVEMHGGTVVAKSEGAGKGSEFVVRLPALRDRLVASDVLVDRPTTLHRCRILVVDDNVDSAETLAALLRRGGSEVYTAHDAQRALEAAQKLQPACVLLDIGLPGMSGYDVCRALRAAPWGKNMVLVAVTGWGQEADRRESLHAGFDHHLVKPVDYRELTALLSRENGDAHNIRS